MRTDVLRIAALATILFATQPAMAVCGMPGEKPSATPDAALTALGSPSPAPEPPFPVSVPADDPPPVLPFSVETSGGALSLRTGLGGLRDYESRELARKLESVRPALPPGSKVPKPASVKAPPIEVWTGVEANGLDSTSPGGEPNANLKTSLGADYRFTATSTAGVAIERQEPAEITARAPVKQDDRLSAYVSLGAVPGVTIETKAQWERSGSGAGEAEATANDKMSISVAPRIGHRFSAGEGATIEPYVTVRREVDSAGRIGSGAGTGPASTLMSKDSAGAGVTFAKPDTYSLGISTSLDGVGATDPASVSGKLQLKLPLR